MSPSVGLLLHNDASKAEYQHEIHLGGRTLRMILPRQTQALKPLLACYGRLPGVHYDGLYPIAIDLHDS